MTSVRRDGGEPSLKVSVVVITYNQAAFIRQCLQSVVDQETTFDFEIIVGDDCSTDGTLDIVREFKTRYPTKIQMIVQERNTRGIENNSDVHRAANGEYVAHMDGDDYALPGKLQQQADFLDRYRECSFVCHRVRIISEDGTRALGVRPVGRKRQFTDLGQLVQDHAFFVNSSRMYRRSANVFGYAPRPPKIDFFNHLEHASQGPVGFIPDVLGCYRKTGDGITSVGGPDLYRLFDMTVDAFERARELGVADATVDEAKARYLVGAAVLCLSRNDVAGYRQYLEASRISGRRMSPTHALLYAMRGQTRAVRGLARQRARLVGWWQSIR